jgi:hypothetical protein
MEKKKTIPENSDADGRLCKLGGAAALIVALLTLGEVIALAIYPQPGTIIDWYALFQNNWIVGLLDFWILEIPMYGLFALVFLALYNALGKGAGSRMAVAMVFALLGIGIFLATNNPFSMLSLSHQYAAAATEVDRSTLLAAGQAVLAQTGQRAVGGFNAGLFLVTIAGLIAASAMYRNNLFGRPAAVVGMLAHALSLADFLREALTKSEVVTLLVVLPNALLLIVWYLLIGRRLWRLGKPERGIPPG